jgi:hypothetical protein
MTIPVIDGDRPIKLVVTAQEIGLAWSQRLRPTEYMGLILEKLRQLMPDAVEGVLMPRLVRGKLMKQKPGIMAGMNGDMVYVWMSDNYYAAMRKASARWES